MGECARMQFSAGSVYLVSFFELIFLVAYTDRVNLEWQVSCAIEIAWSTE
jgi:hypothetical protein